TGSLMKLFDGTGFLIFKTRPKVITAYIRGGERLPLSRAPGLKRWFPRVSVHFSDKLTPPGLDQISATAARARLTDWLRDQMVRQHFETEMAFGPATLPEAIVETARQRPRQVIVQDATLQELTYRRLLTGADLLAGQWRAVLSDTEQRVGVLLPNVNAMPAAILSLWATGKTPAILNYSMGSGVLLACARLAGLRQIITSKVFVQRAKLDLGPLQDAGMELLFLEDVRVRITRPQRFLALFRQFVSPLLSTLNYPATTDAAAVILFTSGSEG